MVIIIGIRGASDRNMTVAGGYGYHPGIITDRRRLRFDLLDNAQGGGQIEEENSSRGWWVGQRTETRAGWRENPVIQSLVT